MAFTENQFNKVKKKIASHPKRTIACVGGATFFFGFGAAAAFNYYLIISHNPFIEHLRSSLNYTSSIFGDGILLPIVNMLVAAFLLKNASYVSKKLVQVALLSGIIITAYFHLTQAMQGLVNWAMPTPWHWNILGLWHAIYMLSVTSFLSLFYLLVIKIAFAEKRVSKHALVVSLGIILFFFLLKMDYQSVNVQQAFASDVSRTRSHISELIQNGDSQLRRLSPIPQLEN